MPYVDLVSKDDYASIWYQTNAPYRNVGSFDPTKPTIVMLHPLHLDSSWLYPQLDDPRLDDNYNIIVFDTRVTGKSICRFNGKYDLWVQAADIAHTFYHLQLPPAHFFASEVFVLTVLRFAALFPDLCLSLTLCNVCAPTEMKAVFDSFEELCQLWSYAEDLETFEYGNRELLNANAGPLAHPDLQDELVAFWQIKYPPFRRSHLITFAQICLNRTPMTDAELQSIKVPVLCIQADQNTLYPKSYADQLISRLTNVEGGAVLYSVKASLGFITIMSSSIVNKVFARFLSRQAPARSDLKPYDQPLSEFMKKALGRLASFKVDSTIMMRDPRSPLSFSCATEEVRGSQEATVLAYAKGQRGAFSPLGADGRPLRKFSERKDHWLDGGADGFSYADPSKLKIIQEQPAPTGKRRGKTGNGHRSETPPQHSSDSLDEVEIPFTEPVSSAQQLQARSRRMFIGGGPTAEQQVVKGSMAKVMQSHGQSMTGVPLARILR